MKWRMQKKTLSDGSSVWDVTDGATHFACYDEAAAWAFLEAIDEYTLEECEDGI